MHGRDAHLPRPHPRLRLLGTATRLTPIFAYLLRLRTWIVRTSPTGGSGFSRPTLITLMVTVMGLDARADDRNEKRAARRPGMTRTKLGYPGGSEPGVRESPQGHFPTAWNAEGEIRTPEGLAAHQISNLARSTGLRYLSTRAIARGKKYLVPCLGLTDAATPRHRARTRARAGRGCTLRESADGLRRSCRSPSRRGSRRRPAQG